MTDRQTASRAKNHRGRPSWLLLRGTLQVAESERECGSAEKTTEIGTPTQSGSDNKLTPQEAQS